MLQWWYHRSALQAGLLVAAVSAVVVGLVVASSPSPSGVPGDAEEGLVFGLLMGAALGATAGTTRRRQLALARDDGPGSARAALAASHGGEVPLDPRLREGALHLAVARLAVTRPRAGWFALVMLGGLVAIWWSWWSVSPAPWLFAAVMTWLAVGEVRAPRVIQRRILELDTGRTLSDGAVSAPVTAR